MVDRSTTSGSCTRYRSSPALALMHIRAAQEKKREKGKGVQGPPVMSGLGRLAASVFSSDPVIRI